MHQDKMAGQHASEQLQQFLNNKKSSVKTFRALNCYERSTRCLKTTSDCSTQNHTMHKYWILSICVTHFLTSDHEFGLYEAKGSDVDIRRGSQNRTHIRESVNIILALAVDLDLDL